MEIYACRFCDKNIELKDLFIHLNNSHGPKNPTDMVKCPVGYCTKEYTIQQSQFIALHIKLYHFISQVTCSFCKNKFPSMEACEEHKKKAHMNLKKLKKVKKPPNGFFEFRKNGCPASNISFLSDVIDNIKEHIVYCRFCGSKIIVDKYKQHCLKRHSIPEVNLQCPVITCNEQFPTEDTKLLMYHIKEKHARCKYKCRVCQEPYYTFDEKLVHEIQSHQVGESTVRIIVKLKEVERMNYSIFFNFQNEMRRRQSNFDNNLATVRTSLIMLNYLW
jgi:hypothetical protein